MTLPTVHLLGPGEEIIGPVNGMTDLAAGPLAAGQVYVGDGAGGMVPTDASTLAGTPARRVVSFTTAALAHLATEQGSVSVEKSCLALQVEADAVCWIRLYAVGGAVTADAGRIITADPTPGQGILLDVLPVAPNTPIILSPPVILQNADSPVATTIYYSVQNRSGAAAAITVDLTIVKSES